MVEIGVEAMANPLVSIGLVVVSCLAGFSLYWLRRFVQQVESISVKLESVCEQIAELTLDVRVIIEKNTTTKQKIEKLDGKIENINILVSAHATDLGVLNQKLKTLEDRQK